MAVKIERPNAKGNLETVSIFNGSEIRGPHPIIFPQGEVMFWEAAGATGFRTDSLQLQVWPIRPDIVLPIIQLNGPRVPLDQGCVVFHEFGTQVVYVKNVVLTGEQQTLARFTVTPTKKSY